MGTIIQGANATLVFNGTDISVFGTISSASDNQLRQIPGSPITAYSIDGGDPTTYTSIALQNTTQYNVTFFKAAGLAPNVSHALFITTQNQGFFFLDWIQVDGIPVELPAGVPTTNSTNAVPDFGHSASSITPGDISSIALGSIIFLCIIIATALIYLVRHRKKKEAILTELDIVEIMESHVQDYTRINPFRIRQVRSSQWQTTLPPPYSSGDRSQYKSAGSRLV
ncbi:hypothetical protein D9613_008876 [Agrocybe pediades]|uniref:Uncharacterized protein n=1 Tax=Agrocybe pediades TaxID=84607 RepID=A0A8H4QSY1_9AGAR|nr:hypothetical protein D9613_008876 [Agrocybe pediades]